MIISASRRSDIPAFYHEWFCNRLKAGEVLVRNPFNARQVRRVSLSPDVVDGIVFWTRNPEPMLDRLDILRPYAYYFNFTITGYGSDLEPITHNKDRAADSFRRLADRIGPERVIWRYDPIILTEKYNVEFHLEQHGKLAAQLEGYTEQCIISFLTMYQKCRRNLAGFDVQLPDAELKRRLVRELSKEIPIMTCCEELDLEGVGHASCVDAGRLSRIAGAPLSVPKDRGQRKGCGCAASIDIGAYNCCSHACRYCYANTSPAAAERAEHNPGSPLLLGHLQADDQVTDARQESCRSLF